MASTDIFTSIHPPASPQTLFLGGLTESVKKFGLSILILVLSSAYGTAQNYCIPQTQSYCCGYGIVSVTLPGLSRTSADASAGYENFSTDTALCTEGQAIPVAILTGASGSGLQHDIRIWLDADNNGQFDAAGELVFEASGSVNPSGTLTLPPGTLFDVPLRLRIMADIVGGNPGPCTGPLLGQAEDYTLRIASAGTAPTAGFEASPAQTCNGTVSFHPTGTGNPTAFAWDFGDGFTSASPQPTHTYLQNGAYTVTLTVSNSLGTDQLARTDYIHVNLRENCDTFQVPPSGTASILYNCRHVVMDSGRENNYGDLTNGVLTLAPVSAQRICLRFSEFHFETQFDYIELFDGPTPASPLIGRYTGTQMPPDVCSTGPALCIRQYSDDLVNYAGFTAQANCLMGDDEIAGAVFSVFPNPFAEELTVALPPGPAGSCRVTLLSVSGQAVFSRVFSDGPTLHIDLGGQNLPPGLYWIQVRTAQGVWQQKILKVS